MNVPGNGPYQIGSWPKKDIQAHIGFMKALQPEAARCGRIRGRRRAVRAGPGQLVRAGTDGTPVTDGVFPESKEFLAGYWIVDVDSAGARLRRSRPRRRRRPVQAARRSTWPIEVRAGDERRRLTCCDRSRASIQHAEHLLRDLAPQVLGAVIRRYRRLRGRRRTRCRKRCSPPRMQWPRDGRARQPARLADPGRVAPDGRSRPQRDRPAAARARGGARCSAQVVAAASVESRRDEDDTLDAALHVLPPGADHGVGDRADAARGRRPDHRGDRQRVSRARSDDGAADQPGQADDPARRASRSSCPERRARAERLDASAARALSDLQRGLHRQRRAPSLQRPTWRPRPSGSRGRCTGSLPDDAEGERPAGADAPHRRAARRAHRPARRARSRSPQQDRSRWDRAAIDGGVALLTATLSRGPVGPYQLQAADRRGARRGAARTTSTDWAQIARALRTARAHDATTRW